MNLEELYKKSQKQYIHFLKYTNPNKPIFDKSPDNLLELLDNSFKRKINVRTALYTQRLKQKDNGSK